MPLSTAEKTSLIASVQDLTDKVTALVIDPEVNPLQPLLDAALAERDAAQAAAAAAIADVATLQGKIAAAKAAMQEVTAADTIEDQKRAAAIAALE